MRMTLKENYSSILAGICIGIAGTGFLSCKSVGNDLAGAVLFSFGLLAVVHFGLNLYTGKAGFFTKDVSSHTFGNIFIILLFNILGCYMASLFVRTASPYPIQETAISVINSRLSLGAIRCCVLSIGCGVIMTISVYFGKQGKFLPLLFGVPLFIVCGFPHCVADAFYCCCLPNSYISAHIWDLVRFYIAIVFGNFVGCNFPRIFGAYGNLLD